MEIVWSASKNRRLKSTRGVSFDDVIDMLLEKKYLAVLKNPSRPAQWVFILRYRDYTYVVPFAIEGEKIVLKTVFPSRKFHKLYAEKKIEPEA